MLSKKTKMLRLSALSLAVAGAMSFSHAANAEGVDVSGSVGISTAYLWRGDYLGDGVPVVAGDLGVSAAGFHSSVWASTGDTGFGTEYDLIAGYGFEVGGFSADLTVVNYVYSEAKDGKDNFGKFSDAILTLGFAGFSFSYYDNIAGGEFTPNGDSGYAYYTVSYSYDAFSALVGVHDMPEAPDVEWTHLDLAYAYNDNLTFTVSKIIDEGDLTEDAGADTSAKFIVSYSIPLGD